MSVMTKTDESATHLSAQVDVEDTECSKTVLNYLCSVEEKEENKMKMLTEEKGSR